MSLRKLAVIGLFAVVACSAEAQVSRVFVSVSGNDANVCSDVATPCRTLAGGITQVDPEGEVIVMTTGSYAGGTITKPVKIDVASGIVAFSGLPSVVDPGAGNLVVIRGMTIKAVSPGMGNGLSLNTGRLSVENSVVDGWAFGIAVGFSAQQLYVGNSVFRRNVRSIQTLNGASHSVIENTRFIGNGGAYRGYGAISAAISGCEISGGDEGIVNANSSEVFVDNCRISNVVIGLNTSATMRVSRTLVTKSSNCGVWNSGGLFESLGNNVFRGNAYDTCGTITPVGMQ
jgi:hypothetical protein